MMIRERVIPIRNRSKAMRGLNNVNSRHQHMRECVVIVSKNPSVLNTAQTIPIRLSLNNAVFRLTGLQYILAVVLQRDYTSG